jgi:hypothetical protein
MASSKTSNGIVLDDYLHTVASVLRDFKLNIVAPNLSQIQSQPGARASADAIVSAFRSRCGSNICSTVHPLLGDEPGIYGRKIRNDKASRRKIRTGRIETALRRTLELGLQAIVHLPARYKKAAPAAKRLKSLVSIMERLAAKLTSAIHEPEIRGRIDLVENATARTKLSALPLEIRQNAEVLRALAKLKVQRIRIDSPNPQISFTMYFIGWIEAGTAKQHYKELETLIHSAFSAAGKPVPRWADRLAIERQCTSSEERNGPRAYGFVPLPRLRRLLKNDYRIRH